MGAAVQFSAWWRVRRCDVSGVDDTLRMIYRRLAQCTIRIKFQYNGCKEKNKEN
jgi:hypothetical protein